MGATFPCSTLHSADALQSTTLGYSGDRSMPTIGIPQHCLITASLCLNTNYHHMYSGNVQLADPNFNSPSTIDLLIDNCSQSLDNQLKLNNFTDNIGDCSSNARNRFYAATLIA